MKKKRGPAHAIIYTDPYGKDHNLGTVYGTTVDVDSIAQKKISAYKKKKGILF